MNAQELAARLNGREYLHEISKGEAAESLRVLLSAERVKVTT